MGMRLPGAFQGLYYASLEKYFGVFRVSSLLNHLLLKWLFIENWGEWRWIPFERSMWERSAQCLLPAVSDSKHCDEGQQVTSRLGKITSREDKVHSPDSLQYWKSIYFHFSETLGPSPPHPLSSTYSSDRHPRSSVSKLSPEHCQASHCSVSLLNSDKSDKSNNDNGGGPSWIQTTQNLGFTKSSRVPSQRY